MHLQIQRSHTDSKAKEKENKKAKAIAGLVAVDSSEPRVEDGQPKTPLTCTTLVSLPPHPFPLSPSIQGLDLEVIRREQRRPIEEGRRELVERGKIEEEKRRAALKKIANIQLQVFVHAR